MPPQRTHRKIIVIPAIIQFQLVAKVLKRIKPMSGIETFIVLTMTSFHFAVVSWSKRTDQLVLYTVFQKTHLKNGGFIRTAIRTKTLGEFLPIVCLNTFNRTRKCLDQVFQKLS